MKHNAHIISWNMPSLVILANLRLTNQFCRQARSNMHRCLQRLAFDGALQFGRAEIFSQIVPSARPTVLLFFGVS